MDMANRFSVVYVFKSSAINEAKFGFEACWLRQFWLPEKIQDDKAFKYACMKKYMDGRDIRVCLVPPNRHNKNPLESERYVRRTLFLSFKMLSLIFLPNYMLVPLSQY